MPTPRKSIAELKATGSYIPNKHGKLEDKPDLPITAPDMPRFVDEMSTDCFNELVRWGLDMSVLTKADSLIVGLLSVEITNL